jgi:TrmH family RNA methyltransferase
MRSPEITSLQNPRVKQVVRLRDHRNRAAGEPLVIDGAREILRAVDAGVELVELFVCDELCRSAEAQTLAEHAHAG